MHLDVVDLRSFYATPLGRVAHRLVLRALRSRWESLHGLALMGLGYAVPYLDALREGSERSFACMPGPQGVVAWPPGRLALSTLVDPLQLPFRDSVVDRALIVHALELSEQPAALLGEVWRVLAPGGHLIVVAPRRAGAWSRVDSTPFGQGQPFSRRQITELMRQALFTPIHWGEALYLPPTQRRTLLSSADQWERIAATLGLPLAGVHVIEATKQVWRPALARAARRRAGSLQPILAPSGNAGFRPPGWPGPD